MGKYQLTLAFLELKNLIDKKMVKNIIIEHQLTNQTQFLLFPFDKPKIPRYYSPRCQGQFLHSSVGRTADC